VALTVVGALICIDAAVIVAIVIRGGGVLHLGAIAISARTVDNPVAVAGLLLLAAAGIRWLPILRTRIDRSELLRDAGQLLLPAAIALLIALPLLGAAFDIWRQGDYVSQRYFWRSAPAGIDVGTAVLGNPSAILWSGLPGQLYRRLGIDAVEQTAWFGPAVLLLCAAAVRLSSQDVELRRWAILGVVFLIWALGPYLVIFGQHVHLLLPATLVRYIPIISNARIPARAIVIVYLAAAIISAIGLRALLSAGRRGWAVVFVGLLIADYAPLAPPWFAIDRPAVYDVLRQEIGPGAVCELPLGLRDGFGETGRFDSRILLYQTIHGRPITGGFVARLPPRIPAAYEADAVLGPLLRLSSGSPLSHEQPVSRDQAAEALRRDQIRYVVINRATSPSDLLAFVHRSLPLRLLASDRDRDLYVVDR
jgi:hypothetical protein